MSFWNDLRYALRLFANNPGATAVAVLSLALAIGPNSALFSVVDRLFLQPGKVQGASQFFFVTSKTDRQDVWETPSYPDFLDYQTQGRGVADFIASEWHAGILNVNGVNELVPMQLVSENYFAVVGVRAAVGRTLVESDARFDGPPPVLLSHSLWQRKFGGAPDIVGKTIMLNFHAFHVLGIAPRGFHAPDDKLFPSDLWIPFSATSVQEGMREMLMRRGNRAITVTARLHDGVSQQGANLALSEVAAQLSREYPATNRGKAVVLRPVVEPGRDRLAIVILLVISLVLLIPCANVVGILLAQGEARRREFAMRVAMGASRRRLVQHVIAESLWLGLAAAALGLLMAHWMIRALTAFQPAALPVTLNLDLRIDGRVLAYTLLLALVTALAAGLAPALRFSRPDLMPALKGEAPGAVSRFWFRGGLIIAQIAFSQFLLAGTGLLVRSYLEVLRIRPGFDSGRNVLFATLLPNTERPNLNYQYLLDQLRSVPGVRRVSSAKNLPLSGSGMAPFRVFVPGVTDEPVNIRGNSVGPEYFTAMGTRILRGRDFEERDSRRLVIVNEAMARRFWGSADRAAGQIVQVDGETVEVAGVVETGKYQWLLEEPTPFFFRFTGGAANLVIETAGDPAAMADSVRRALRAAAPDLTVQALVTVRQQMGMSLFLWQAAAGLLGVSAILGIFLAGVGLYGLVSYGVTRRAHEIGVRMAMGASPADVLKLVLRQGLSMVSIGSAIGLAGAVAAARVVSAVLYRVSPADPAALAAGVLMVAAVALLASHVPARRAVRVDPMMVLRQE